MPESCPMIAPEKSDPGQVMNPVAYRRFFLYGYDDIYDHKQRL